MGGAVAVGEGGGAEAVAVEASMQVEAVVAASPVGDNSRRAVASGTAREMEVNRPRGRRGGWGWARGLGSN